MHKKVIGYQVMNADGRHWNDRDSYEILTEATASKEIDEAWETGEPHWYMVAVREGDIEEPEFEQQL